jgi:hypothetical protein
MRCVTSYMAADLPHEDRSGDSALQLEDCGVSASVSRTARREVDARELDARFGD